MARNEVFREAEALSLPVPAGTKAGDPVLVGSLPGVAQTAADANNNAAVWLDGGFTLQVAGQITQVGSPVYITSGGTLSTTATNNTLFGYALALKGTGTGPVTVKIARV